MGKVIIIGAGPAGLSAAIQAASEGLDTTVIYKKMGGQIGDAVRVENFPGVPDITGADLIAAMRSQAESFGTKFIEGEVIRVVPNTWLYGDISVKYQTPNDVLEGRYMATRDRANAVIIASGGEYKAPPPPLADGVYFACTPEYRGVCDGSDVTIVGAGNSAGQGALALAELAKTVTMIARRPLEDTMSQYLIDRIRTHERITVRHEPLQEQPRGPVFSMIGTCPQSRFVPSYWRNREGFIVDVTIPSAQGGVFVVGDVRAGSVKRASVAAGEGAAIVSRVHKYLADRNKKGAA